MNNDISKQLEDEIVKDSKELIGWCITGEQFDAVKDMIIGRIRREREEYYVRGYNEAIFELQKAIDKLIPKRFSKKE